MFGTQIKLSFNFISYQLCKAPTEVEGHGAIQSLPVFEKQHRFLKYVFLASTSTAFFPAYDSPASLANCYLATLPSVCPALYSSQHLQALWTWQAPSQGRHLCFSCSHTGKLQLSQLELPPVLSLACTPPAFPFGGKRPFLFIDR